MLGEVLKIIRIATMEYETESKAAKIIGITPSYLNRIESGSKYPSDKILKKLSTIYNIPQEKIMSFDRINDKLKLNKQQLLKLILNYYLSDEYLSTKTNKEQETSMQKRK